MFIKSPDKMYIQSHDKCLVVYLNSPNLAKISHVYLH